ELIPQITKNLGHINIKSPEIKLFGQQPVKTCPLSFNTIKECNSINFFTMLLNIPIINTKELRFTRKPALITI
ncbi:MAG: hypothetical protein JXA50_07215, partial [Deltaproteobacteria bacterium]|nr:hypothetical protein [Deltaproteobacteria bacterium]